MESLKESSEQRLRVRLIHSMNQVFNEDMLREMIIGHVISDEIARGSSRTDLRSIRLVQKSWLRDACKCFIKVGKPLYHIELTEENSLNGSQLVQQAGYKLLDRFTRAISSRLEGPVPPFRLSISADFFQEENHSSFSEFLGSCCTAGLIYLDVRIPNKGGSMTYIFPNGHLRFPILKKLMFWFTEKRLQSVSVASSIPNTDAVYFLQSILNGATNLTHLNFPLIQTNLHTVPIQVEYLIVPPTITDLKVHSFPKSSQLNILLRNQLPTITTLAIGVPCIPHSTGLLFKILDKFRTTLRRLIIGKWYRESVDHRNPIFFKFPLMEKLKSIDLLSMYAELEPQLEPLQDLLPELSSLTLQNHTLGMFEKWTRNSKFHGITKVDVSLVNENVRFDSREFYMTFNLEMMQSLHIAFLNVRSLRLRVSGMETSGLKYLFLEMAELTELTLSVMDGNQYVNSDHWDALFVGVPVELAAVLRTTAEFWPYVVVQNEFVASIKRLTKLQSLSLATFRPLDSNGGTTADSLVSDILFQFALLKMSNWKILKFRGRFKSSPEMVEAWRNDKDRTFEYMAVR